METREEEIEQLQEQLRHQTRRPTESNHQTVSSKVKLEKYDGKTSIIQWWFNFLTFINLQKLSDKMAIDTLSFYLKGAAESWFYSFDDAMKRSLTTIKEAIHQRFQPSSQNNLEMMDVKQKS